MKVSILIPAYNAEAYIAEAVTSALKQSWSDTEVIIVDDGSSDSTLSIAKGFQDKRIRIISQKNQGASSARNVAFQASTGDYIQYLDADDLLEEDKIAKQIKKAKRWGSGYMYSSSWGIFYDNVNCAEFNATTLWRDFVNPVDWLVEAWSRQVWMHPGNWLVPRHLIEEAGLWNEALSLHDDGEFFCRVLLRSQGVKFCGDAKSYYRKGINSSLSSIRSERSVRSHWQICHLYKEYLLARENTDRTRKACATNYMCFYYGHYPNYKKMRKKAWVMSQSLGGTDIQPRGTELFYLLNSFLNWRIARRLENIYYRNGLNRASVVNRVSKLIR